MEDDVKNFIETHGFAGRSDYYSYHIALGFYYAYSRDAYRLSEMLHDGEVFDDLEACIVIKNLEISKRAYQYFRGKLFPNLAVFDTSEAVVFHGCRLEGGRLTGETDEAIKTAKKWMRQFYRSNSSRNKIEHILDTGEKMVSGTVFLYEVAAYILYLQGEDVNYKFLEAGHFSEWKSGNES